MRSSSLLVSGIAAVLTVDSTSAFTAQTCATTGRDLVALSAHSRGDASSPLDRSDFLKTSFASIAAIAFSPSVALADDSVDDLSMPSAEEQKASEDAMKERLRIKAELKKKAAKPMGYKESMAQEMNKQKSLQKTKDQKREALCEELGRGC
eukprot:CAMPEP_0196239938 /NCGR_PEP_ID=MMETSP0913-20130531/13022_1 /TAXON_ID=49265 /ORGANISM="Thalassiosira rotula, Strain GSO102" /LENGTH=150 /DNA_ID=CAMNT_0041522033 /DNA_START=59 /DNA_END=511 /DNA_ORIENTATION=+